MRPAIFLDRDGVINENRPDHVKSWQEFVFLPGVFEPLQLLAKSPFLIALVSNQSVINRGIVPRSVVEDIHARMLEAIQRHGGRLDSILYCPHRPDENCACRKPKPGLLLEIASRFDVDLTRSYLIGDALSDIQAALAVGCQPLLVLTGRGRSQQPLVREICGESVLVKPTLAEAVAWILQNANI